MFLNNFSAEFFPPKTIKEINNLNSVITKLSKLNTSYFSITFGTCKSNKYNTLNTMLSIINKGYNVVPHLLCIGYNKLKLNFIINKYISYGIKEIVILRGDINQKYKIENNKINYANELINFIRKKTGNWFNIKVAAYPEKHPESNSLNNDLQYFINKIKSGVNSAITQYFYNSDVYFSFVDKIQKFGINIPIIPGIMPIISFNQLVKFSNICGTKIPKWITSKLFNYGNDIKSIQSFGIDVVTEMCYKLLNNGVPGLHFYTLNKSYFISEIYKNLNLIN